MWPTEGEFLARSCEGDARRALTFGDRSFNYAAFPTAA